MTLEFKSKYLRRLDKTVEKVFDGIHYVIMFKNGYGASIIKHKYSYGSKHDLWELAVLRQYGPEIHVTYDTEITSDVIVTIDENEIIDILKRIKKL